MEKVVLKFGEWRRETAVENGIRGLYVQEILPPGVEPPLRYPKRGEQFGRSYLFTYRGHKDKDGRRIFLPV